MIRVLISNFHRRSGQMWAPVEIDLRPALHFNNEALSIAKRIYR